MKKEHLYITIVVLIVALGISIVFNVYQHCHICDVSGIVKTDTVTKTVYTERRDTAPTMTGEILTGHVNVSDILLHVPYVMLRNGEIPNVSDIVDIKEVQTCLNGQDSRHQAKNDVSDSLNRCQSGNLELPIVQRIFQDSTYTAYVSGIKYGDLPRLDSICKKERVIYQTVTITKDLPCKQKRFHVGIISGYGCGFTSKQVEPYIGIGVSYSIFSF